jgi:dihydroorotate dehydrogenase electron transfer subunit
LTIGPSERLGRAAPGQFLQVRIGEGHDPLLRRPFSVHEVDRRKGLASLLFQVRGRGTVWLAARQPGEALDVMGPLGRGFPQPLPEVTNVLVAGGIGVAPLFFLAQELASAGRRVVFLFGAASRDKLWRLVALQQLGLELAVATEDGSLGYRGLVTGLLQNYLAEKTGSTVVYACGPREMLREVARLGRESGLPVFVCLEQVMACGIGVCLGCAVPTRHGYVRVCKEGPVMAAEEVRWDGTGS